MKLLRNGVEIPDTDLKSLQNDLLNIEDWVNGAIAGKIAACKYRLLEEWMPKLINDPNVARIPADETALINLITSRSDYLSRAAREALAEKADMRSS